AGKFVTFFYAELDPVNGRIRYVNAGHNHPRLRRASGDVEQLKVGGLPLGLFEDKTYEEADVPFQPGDALLLFSDGIPDAVDSFDREYGEERLDVLWKAVGQGPAADTLDHIYRDVVRHRGLAAQNDDLTLVVVSPAAGTP